MFRVTMLASGSKGNAALIKMEGYAFLVDIGIGPQVLKKRLFEAGSEPEGLDGVFITHEHMDHIKGLALFMKKYDVPVFASARTWRAILSREAEIDRRFCHVMDDEIRCGDVSVKSFPVLHDAADPRGYIFSLGARKCAYVTDTGFVSDAVRHAAEDAEILIIEANHDLEMLKNGIYPEDLKHRISGNRGHLSNAAAGWLLSQLKSLPKSVILAHLSQENNRPDLAFETVNSMLGIRGQEIRITVASQDFIVSDF
ncbi:MAG: MBL fold metallo-hydrolase [Phascolarctobacterium sp.]|nr:MBL fold metallo-hydrolase [Phascolarctobacterium sp.]